MLSTIRLLSPEVLSNIFLLCPPDEIDHYSNTKLNCSIPWSISRVCRKWRSICLSTPRLWVHIPTIYLNYEYKSGFFELLRSAIELSFPHDIELRLRDTNAEKIERFENIFPRVHRLEVQLDLPMIKGFVQRKESFKRLKSLAIYFKSGPSEDLPTLDFLTPVISLSLSCHDFYRKRGDLSAPLRPIDCHWPKLTTFHGDFLPASFLRRILFAAPLLREVTMEDVKDIPFDSSTASPASICHTNIECLSLTCDIVTCLSRELLQRLHLPGLKNLHVEYTILSPETFLSFLRETHGSLVKLTLKEPLGTLDNQREMYTLCPALNTFTLSHAASENLDILVVSPQSKLCPALRHLTLRDLVLHDDESARVLEDFCSSRGLTPFNSPAALCQLDRITVYPTPVYLFHQHCLRVDQDCPLMSPPGLPSYSRSELSKKDLEDLNQIITTATTYFLILLEVCHFLPLSLKP